MTKKLLPLLTLTAIAATPAAALADGSDRAESAMRKGIRDYAANVAKAKASEIRVDAAKAIDDVGEKTAVTGTFQLTKGGRTVTYRLTSKARVLRLSPSGLEYRVSAQAVKQAEGLPKSTGAFSGFLQGPAARES